MSDSVRFKLFRLTTPGPDMPAYTGLIEVPRAGLYWIDGFIDKTASGETYIRGDVCIYTGTPPQNRTPIPEPLRAGEMQTQPGFWPSRGAKRER